MLVWLIISIVLVAITLSLTVIYLIKVYKEQDLDEVVCSIFAAINFLSIINLTLAGTFYSLYIQEYTKFITNIMSINRESGITGSFALGCGYVQSKQYYYYYYETDNGVLLGKVDAEITYIVETDQYEPALYELKQYGKVSIDYLVYVPYGTIITNFVLN